MKYSAGIIELGEGERKVLVPLVQEVEVAVSLIAGDAGILAVFNEEWGSFTLPMTKRRTWQPPRVQDSGPEIWEDWSDAALRCFAEALGVISDQRPTLLKEIEDILQNEEPGGEWRRYRFNVFRFDVEGDPPIRTGTTAHWIAVDDFLDEAQRPISKTARFLVDNLRSSNLV
ncbi:hypothetical protein ACFLSJ_03360 [Verrucomicrobiota bacterium]